MRNPLLQRIYRRLHRFALQRMNYGQWDPSTSGERFALRYIVARCPAAEPIVFDVGANIGQYAAEISAVAPHARIYCFEPAAAAFAKLAESLRGTPVHAAVGAQPGIFLDPAPPAAISNEIAPGTGISAAVAISA